MLPLYLILFLISCSDVSPEKSAGQYNFSSPSDIYHLPRELEEISGIAYRNPEEILCVQDEKGAVYTYNLSEKKITSSVRFADSADYEEVAMAGEDVFILESDGDIYRINNFFDEEKRKPGRFDTHLKNKNNTEGMCYLPEKKQLLIACKNKPQKGDDNKKEFFVFDTETNTLWENSAFSISVKKLNQFAKQNKENLSPRLKKILKDDDINDLITPSGIAFHPLTEEIYILSSKNKILVITDDQGNIRNVYEIASPDLSQPEGITFSETGDLFISNEGKKGKANILKYKYEK